MPNQEQIKSIVRWAIAVFGTVAVTRGWISAGQLQMLGGDLTFEVIFAVVGALASVAAGVWGLFVHGKANTVAVVAAMPEVAKVETMPTPEGLKLAIDAGSTPQAVVTVAPIT